MKRLYHEAEHEDKREVPKGCDDHGSEIKQRSGVEHLSEGARICGERERPNAVTSCHFLDFVLHSERTEKNGSPVQMPDGLDERFAALRMVAIDQHSTRALLPDRIIDAF